MNAIDLHPKLEQVVVMVLGFLMLVQLEDLDWKLAELLIFLSEQE